MATGEIGIEVVIGTGINVIVTVTAIGTEAVVITKTQEATTKDRWSENGITDMEAVVVKMMIE